MISREKVNELLDKYITTRYLRLHMRESEVIMIALAKYFEEDENVWGISGLIHDLDYDYVDKDPKRHVVEFDDVLKMENLKIGEDIPEEMYHAVKAHYEEHPDISQKRESKLDYALSASETLSGFLVSCTLVLPSKKIADLRVESVMKKFKSKAFSKAVRRDLIYDIEKIGLPLEKFVQIAIEAMCSISDEIGL